jgi:CheY-like chemotaxis protein
MGFTVLSIEDEAEINELLGAVLDGATLEVVTAATATEGLELLNSLRPDLVLLDIMLPDMDGWSVYDAIRNDPDPDISRLPIVILTALRREFQARRNFRESAHDYYLTKPFDTLQLRTKIEQMLGAQLW